MSARGVTEHDVPWLVHGIKRIRSETYGAATWDEAGIVAAVRPLVGQNFPITIERVFAHAADPEARTPKAIHRPFTPKTLPPRQGPSKKEDECPDHPGQPRQPFCGGHRADQLAAAYDDEIEPVEIPEGLTGPELVRAAAGLPIKCPPGTDLISTAVNGAIATGRPTAATTEQEEA